MTDKSALDELNEILADDGWTVEPHLNAAGEVGTFVLKDSTGKVLYEMPHTPPPRPEKETPTTRPIYRMDEPSQSMERIWTRFSVDILFITHSITERITNSRHFLQFS